MKKPVVYLGFPMYSRHGNDYGAVLAWANNATRRPDLFDVLPRESRGGYTFANLWAEALTLREQGLVTHFAMIHTDVAPEPFWLDKLWHILHERRAKILSCVIAMKDDTEDTSTGYRRLWGPKETLGVTKLKLDQTDALPETFSIKDVRPKDHEHYCLCLNTGLWLADITGPWAERLSWTSRGGIMPVTKDGRKVYQSWFESEDWLESKNLATLLSPNEVLATRAVVCGHYGWFCVQNTKRKPAEPSCEHCNDTRLVDTGGDVLPCTRCPTPGSSPRAGTALSGPIPAPLACA